LIDNGADVISCSWGTTDSAFDLNPMKIAAISKAAREGRNGKGCVILFAVGNDDLDYVSYYAAHPDVIAVAATTSKDEHADYSNRGREVTICAPSNGDWPITAARASWDEGISWETGEYRWWRDIRSNTDTVESMPIKRLLKLCVVRIRAMNRLWWTIDDARTLLRRVKDQGINGFVRAIKDLA